MPLYEMRCPACGSEFEVLCAHGARHEQACPECSMQPCEAKPTLFRREREFHGSETLSLCHGFSPEEVREARRDLPSWDIKDNGDVHFRNRSHYRTCMKERKAAESLKANCAAEAAQNNRQAAASGAP